MNVYPIPTLDPVLSLYSLQLTTEEERKFYLHLLPCLSKVACIPLANHLTSFEAIVLFVFTCGKSLCSFFFPQIVPENIERNSPWGLHEVSGHDGEANVAKELPMAFRNCGWPMKLEGGLQPIARKTQQPPVKQMQGNEFCQHPKWAWNCVLPQLIFQMKMHPDWHFDYSPVTPEAEDSAKPCLEPWPMETDNKCMTF